MILCKKFKRIPTINDKIEDNINEWLADNPDIKILNTLTSLTDEIFIFFEKISEIEKLANKLHLTEDYLMSIFHICCPSGYDHAGRIYRYYPENDLMKEIMAYLTKIGKIDDSSRV